MAGPGLMANGGMADWVIPRGDNFFNTPIIMAGQSGVTWRGYGGSKVSRLIYIGPPTEAFIQVVGSSRCFLKDFEIVIGSTGVKRAVLVTNLPPGQHASTANTFSNIRVMHGGRPTSAEYAFSIDSTALGGVDGNNDHHKFIGCYAQHQSVAGFHINGTQVHHLIFEQCFAHDAAGRRPTGWLAMNGVYFALRDCGGNTNGADIKIGAAVTNLQVVNWNSENSRQFLVGETSGETFEKIDGVRWEGQPLANTPAIDVRGPGPRSISNANFAGINGICPQIRVTDGNAALSVGSFEMNGVMIRQHLGTVPATPLVSVPVQHEVRMFGVKHQRINENGSRTNASVAVNTPQTA